MICQICGEPDGFGEQWLCGECRELINECRPFYKDNTISSDHEMVSRDCEISGSKQVTLDKINQKIENRVMATIELCDGTEESIEDLAEYFAHCVDRSQAIYCTVWLCERFGTMVGLNFAKRYSWLS